MSASVFVYVYMYHMTGSVCMFVGACSAMERRRRRGRRREGECNGITDEKKAALEADYTVAVRIPHLLSSWLMIMYISQVVSSAIPP